MDRVARLVCVLFALTLLPSSAIAQGPPPPPPPPPPPAPMLRDGTPNKTGTGRLSGRVTSLETGRPIRRAVVNLGGPEMREGKSVSTDAEGRWELRDLPAGRLSLMVTKGGYVSLQYGQRRPYETGKQIDLAAGQSIDKIDIALPRGGAITGRVLDEAGEPLTNVRVNATRYQFVAGQRRLSPAGMIDTTDDLGQFRIYGLAPGDYYVIAQPQTTEFLTVSGDRTGYARTYYPNAYSPSDATRVTLTVGQEARDLVIAIAPTRLVTLSGTVTSADGQPVKAGMVRIMEPNALSPLGSRPGVIQPDGGWTISGVVPGEYRLMAQMLRGTFEDVANTGRSSFPESVDMPITVGAEDISGIALVTSKGNVIRGQVKWEGGTAPTGSLTNGAVIAINPDMTMLGSPSASIKEDGTFEVGNITGKRRLRAVGFPRGWYLKSIAHDGHDITDATIDVSQDVNGVEITLTQRAGELTGSVQSSKGTAVTDYVVLLFAPEPERWGWQSRYVHAARPDQTGRFTITGIPEASYLAVALEYVEPGEETNPEFLEKLKAVATRISVTEGEKKTLTLKLSAQ